MSALWIALGSMALLVGAYVTYGRYLAVRIFDINPNALVPSKEVNDGVDYVPTSRAVVFGHHFTSIAGTGPIVGPAVAVLWGWLPALLWVLCGSILIGAVHDFGSLVVSLRSRGQTIGDIAGRMISTRARLIFLVILFFALMVVLAIFGLVIAVIFSTYPQTVLSVWISMPLAIGMGLWINRHGGNLFLPSLGALVLVYVAVVVGVKWLPISFGEDVPLYAGAGASLFSSLKSSVVLWTLILLAYCYAASVMPVWLLLQPRDYINALQLVVALLLLVGGLVVAQPLMVAPAVHLDVAGAPPILPFLFITIACGAISGFHCLVSSGTSSKQLCSEADAQAVGYGSMLLEGALAVLVILACCAGLGMGVTRGGEVFTGAAAWQVFYSGDWKSMGLAQQVGAFVEGGGNMVAALGIPGDIAIAIMAVMVACFAATTMDTATRLQRYIIQELGAAMRVKPLTNKYVATGVAVVTGGAMAMIAGPSGPGSGGLILWPLFGAINQMLAGLAFLVVAFYLIRHNKPIWFLVAPLILMIVLPTWAMVHQLSGFYQAGNWLLVGLGGLVQALQLWIVVEGILMWRKAKGILPAPLPPFQPARATAD